MHIYAGSFLEGDMMGFKESMALHKYAENTVSVCACGCGKTVIGFVCYRTRDGRPLASSECGARYEKEHRPDYGRPTGITTTN